MGKLAHGGTARTGTPTGSRRPIEVAVVVGLLAALGVAGGTADAQEARQAAQPPQKIVWNLGHPPERLRFPANRQAEFTVSAGESGATGLCLAQSTLQDADTLLQLNASQLQLCADDGTCDKPIDIPANNTRRVTLKISPAFRKPGVFSGEVSFRVAGTPEMQSFKWTVYSRRCYAMAAGAVAIAAGLLLYFVINVMLRRRIAVDEALFPVYQLRDTVTALRRKVANASTLTSVALDPLTNELKTVNEQLAPKALARLLPPLLYLPTSSATDWQEKFKAHIAPLADHAGALVTLVNSGVQHAISYWVTNPTEVRKALRDIANLASSVRSADAAQAQLAPILLALQTAVSPPHPALGPLLQAAPAASLARWLTFPPDTQTLKVRLLRNTLWLWCLVALIALVSGFYSLVLENFAFGSCTDYMKCFFWGLGFSVAGSQLEQLTQPSVASSFGINIPKA